MKLQTPNSNHQGRPKHQPIIHPSRGLGFGGWGLGFSWVLVFWVLTAGSVALAAAEQKVKNVGVYEFDKLRKQTNSIVLDVRTPQEYVAGRTPRATNNDLDDVGFEEKDFGFDKK